MRKPSSKLNVKPLLPKIETEVRWEIKDKNGRVVKRGRKYNDLALNNLFYLLRLILLHWNSPLTSLNGASYTMRAIYSNVPTGSYSGMYLWLGSGSTPPSRSDYKLESPITAIAATKNAWADNENSRYVYELRINWTPSTPTTIREIGVYKSIRGYDTSYAVRTLSILLFRTLTDEINLEAYQSITFWFYIYIPYGT